MKIYTQSLFLQGHRELPLLQHQYKMSHYQLNKVELMHSNNMFLYYSHKKHAFLSK